jgi:hypothetical protein
MHVGLPEERGVLQHLNPQQQTQDISSSIHSTRANANAFIFIRVFT